MIIGGLAASLLGRPRTTRDVDAVVLLAPERWSDFLGSGKDFGFIPRYSDTLAFAQEARVLLLRHQPTGVDVDLALGLLQFEQEAIGRAVLVKIETVLVPLPTPEDLIIMKAVAHRERDWFDIEGLLDAHPDVDLRRVRRWVRVFAKALDAKEVYDDLQRSLTRRRPRKKGKRKS